MSEITELEAEGFFSWIDRRNYNGVGGNNDKYVALHNFEHLLSINKLPETLAARAGGSTNAGILLNVMEKAISDPEYNKSYPEHDKSKFLHLQEFLNAARGYEVLE